jgi:hypothetical protein
VDGGETVRLSVQELNWQHDGFDYWSNKQHQAL